MFFYEQSFTNAPFGFMPMLGMISLLGIIVNNAIMLIRNNFV